MTIGDYTEKVGSYQYGSIIIWGGMKGRLKRKKKREEKERAHVYQQKNSTDTKVTICNRMGGEPKAITIENDNRKNREINPPRRGYGRDWLRDGGTQKGRGGISERISIDVESPGRGRIETTRLTQKRREAAKKSRKHLTTRCRKQIATPQP